MTFLYGFLSACILWATVAVLYYVRALHRVRTMQRYMRHDAAQIVHAAANTVYHPFHYTGNQQDDLSLKRAQEQLNYTKTPKRPLPKISRQQRLYEAQRRKAVRENVRLNALQGNSHWLVLPTNNGQTVRPAPIPSETAPVPPASEYSPQCHGTASPSVAETSPVAD